MTVLEDALRYYRRTVRRHLLIVGILFAILAVCIGLVIANGYYKEGELPLLVAVCFLPLLLLLPLVGVTRRSLLRFDSAYSALDDDARAALEANWSGAMPLAKSTYMTRGFLVEFQTGSLLPLAQVERLWFLETLHLLNFLPMLKSHSLHVVCHGKKHAFNLSKRTYNHDTFTILSAVKDANPDVRIGQR